MSFARVNALGWGLYEELTSAQVNALDTNQSRAMDATFGGSYSPAEDIEFPGANSIEWQTSRYPKLSSRTISRVLFPFPAGRSNFSGAGTDWSNAGNNGSLTQGYSHATNVPVALIEIPRIDLATLTAVKCRAKAVGGHPDIPTIMPKIELVYVLDAVQTIVASQTDPSASASAYQLDHDVNITGLSHVVDASNRRGYALRWYGEAGTFAATGLQLYEITLDYTVALVTPGG